MQERQREWISSQFLHLPGPDSPSGAPIAVHVRVKSFEGDVDTPRSATALIYLREDALEPVHDLEAALGGDMAADADVHALLASQRHSGRDDSLEIPHRCHVKLKDLHQAFMGRNFILRRIAQDALDPAALSDELDESWVKSVKQRNCS